MTIITGVVIALANWYVPTVLYCSDRLVNTTNPQNEMESGRTLSIDRLLGEKTSSFAQSNRPSEVTIKCVRVSVILGKP